MRTFRVKIECEGAAFEDDGQSIDCFEVSRILKIIANQVEGGREKGPALDSNGNTCGSWSISEDAK